MNADKSVLNGTANSGSVDAFVTDYLSKRMLLSGRGKGKSKLDSKSLECYLDAMNDLRTHQIAHEAWRFPTDYEKL